MLILAGGILVSLVVLAFAGFILTVFANWIFNAPKDETDYQAPNQSSSKS
jgi:hypothetical protein